MKVTRREALKRTGAGLVALSMLDIFRARLVQAETGGARSIADRLSALPPQAVKLDGYLQRYIRQSMQHWNKGVVPYVALAEYFRSGRPTYNYKGETKELFAAGELWGKVVQSAVLFYRYTGDAELKQILKKTIADILSTRRDNGAISCVPPAKQTQDNGGELWERMYVLLALDEYYEWVERDPAVLKSLIEQADATVSQFGPSPKTGVTTHGWSSTRLESSGILGSILRVYKRAGDPRYLDFARYIVEAEGGAKGHDIFAEVLEGRDPKDWGGVYPKANEMSLVFEGLVEYYRVTGDERWREAGTRFLRKVAEKEITLVGNAGADQPYHPDVMGEAWDNTALEQTNPDIKRMMETCVGVSWTKFCHQYLLLTADPLAVDYIELLAYNGLIGAMQPSGEGFSYHNYLNGVKTDIEGWGVHVGDLHVTCCGASGPTGLAYLPLTAVMSDAEGPVVNLYNACKATVPLADGSTELNIATNYPLDGEVRIEVSPVAARRFTVKLRIPAWSRATALKVNGKKLKTSPGAYVRIDRNWSRGDVIRLKLDMRCRLIPGPKGSHPQSANFQALMRGPVVLSRDENIDPRFAEAVDVISKDGFVAVKPVIPTLSTASMQFEVPTRSGPIQMVDYASVDSWGGKQVQTWLPLATVKS